MKKYLLLVVICLLCYISYDYFVYYQGSLYFASTDKIHSFTKTQDEKLWIDEGHGFEVFDLKGVNLGLGKPGKFATEYGITKEEYLRWFKQIQDLGANTIRTYTLAHEAFYEAFYDYNINNPTPLYLVHGVGVDDYLQHSHRDAFDEKFYNMFLNRCQDVVDVINGRHKSSKLQKVGTQTYKKDISPWVYGYLIGAEWEGDLVIFTNKAKTNRPQFEGEYLSTENASNFEIFLAMVGDDMIQYESRKYGQQRTLAFSNWPATDPFEYPENVALQFKKYARINVENIKSEDKYISGQYASYQAYPSYPEYAYFMDESIDNSYLDYLLTLNAHHTMPVVISEFGIPSSRGMASYEENKLLGRNEGQMSEQDQGHALVSLYQDIKESGCAGAMVFEWQDEWFKRSSNTLPFVNLDRNVYWSDDQTNTQAYGLLSFDPGEQESICQVDGDKSDWQKKDLVIEEGDQRLSMKYDEKYIYFLAEKKDVQSFRDKLYIPLDLTPKSGSDSIKGHNLNTSHATDFLIEINTKSQSRVWVQEYYNATQTIYQKQVALGNNPYESPPEKNSSEFTKIDLVLNEFNYFNEGQEIPYTQYDFASKDGGYYHLLQTYETGKLTYGNANPKADDFNSLADFCFGQDFVEIKLPWQLLNFADPTQMKIHDDYYEHFGVEYMGITTMNVGIGNHQKLIEMIPFHLKKLGNNPKYHERLKKSYDILQDYWTQN